MQSAVAVSVTRLFVYVLDQFKRAVLAQAVRLAAFNDLIMKNPARSTTLKLKVPKQTATR
jgi:hypothetical protein